MEWITMEEKRIYILYPSMEWITMEEKGTYISYPIHGVISMGEKGAYILYPVHRVDQCGREGDIYTTPLPRDESVWKRRGHIYCTSSTGRIRVGEKGTYILFPFQGLFHGVNQYGREGGKGVEARDGG